jgi:hypothetical protein
MILVDAALSPNPASFNLCGRWRYYRRSSGAMCLEAKASAAGTKMPASWWASMWSGPVAVLQLYTDRRCIVFQIFHADYVPTVLARFLTDSRFTFIGVNVRTSTDKMHAEYELEVGNAADLRGLTKMLSLDPDVSTMTSSFQLENGTGLVQRCH